MEFIAANMAPIMFAALVIFLLLGYPVAFALAANGIFFGLIGIQLGLLPPSIIPPSLVLIIMADQLGKSVGDMYAGAFIPGITLAGLYAVFTIGVAVFKPAWAPALPLDARRLREPSGSTGTPSFGVLAVLSVIVAVLFDRFYYVPSYPEAMLDERLVLSAGAGAAFALASAFVNRTFKLGLLSRLAEQVVFVLIPPLGLIFLVLGPIFLGWATPTDGGAMGASGALG